MNRTDKRTVDTVAGQAVLTPTYLALMASSGAVAAVGLLTSSVPLLVGSMVIAPVLPPLALVAFAVTGWHPRLALRGLLVGAAGLAVSTAAAMAVTWLLNTTGVVPPHTNLVDKPLLRERLSPGWYSVVAALAAGIAGAIGLTKQKTDTLVGVVAAVALVPSVAASGIALVSGAFRQSLDGVVLLAINAAAIVAMGAATLLVLRPDRVR